jgi:hypothetical protein
MKNVVLALITGVLVAGCIARSITGRRLTGTCDGACDHYLSCKQRDDQASRQRCLSECPQVFSDAQSLRMFENLSCRDAVEFVDGTAVLPNPSPSPSPSSGSSTSPSPISDSGYRHCGSGPQTPASSQ